MGISYCKKIQCNGCGATLSFEDGKYSVECEYCKVKNTRPTMITPEKEEEYNQAVNLRKQGEFDKAATMFNSLIADFGTVAEFYWEMLMCNYGIIFVEDANPNSPRRIIPTMVKKKETFIVDDPDYKSAIKYAPADVKEVYREQVGIIYEYQKKYSEFSLEKPYDVFISYKTHDDTTKEKTEDSKIAYQIYRCLNTAGYRVFMADISLKAGEDYEPRIFNALTSAKVMIVVATKKEYVEAVWVKNEWSRFLILMRSSERVKRTVIPVYRDVDPYELPQELFAKQALDASKLGLEDEILQYVDKYVSPENDSYLIENMQKQLQELQKNSDPEEFLKSAEALMNNGVYNDELFKQINKALELDPKCSKAYWYRALAQNKRNVGNIEYSFVDFSVSPDVYNACNLGTPEEKQYYNHVIEKCRKNIELKNEYDGRIDELNRRYAPNEMNTDMHEEKSHLEGKALRYSRYVDEKRQPKKTLINNIINAAGIILLVFSTLYMYYSITKGGENLLEVSDDVTFAAFERPSTILFWIAGILTTVELVKFTSGKVVQLIFSSLIPVPIVLIYNNTSPSSYWRIWIILFSVIYIVFFVVRGIINIIVRMSRYAKIKRFEKHKNRYINIINDIENSYSSELQNINSDIRNRAEAMKIQINYVSPDYLIIQYEREKQSFGHPISQSMQLQDIYQ